MTNILAPLALITAFFVYYMLCFKWDWMRYHWPLTTKRQLQHDVEMTILVMEAIHGIDPDRIDFDWYLDPDLQPTRQARIVQAERDRQWANLPTL